MGKNGLRWILAVVLALILTLPVLATELVPVGQAVGLELGGGITVAGLESDAARQAGLKEGDVILSVNGVTVEDVQSLKRAVAGSEGTVALTIRRDGETATLAVTPQEQEGERRLGVYVRQGVAGIGTVTWYDPETGTFGALGHGVSDRAGELVAVDSGRAVPASVAGVQRGCCGAPGQLQGTYDTAVTLGSLDSNTRCGIFGRTDTGWTGRCLPVAEPDQVHAGAATILSNVDGRQVQEFSVEILKASPQEPSRNLLLRVTDAALLEKTGGIVQGMSGSPILQDGRIVGAVTHVLVSDPTMGYGIFIENMLDAAS